MTPEFNFSISHYLPTVVAEDEQGKSAHELAAPVSPASSTGRGFDILDRLHPSLTTTFIPLPSDLAIRLTADQLSAWFSGTDRRGALRDMVKQARAKRGQHVA